MDASGGIEAVAEIKRATGCETPLLIVRDAGHHIYLDNPTDFNNLVISIMHEVKDIP